MNLTAGCPSWNTRPPGRMGVQDVVVGDERGSRAVVQSCRTEHNRLGNGSHHLDTLESTELFFRFGQGLHTVERPEFPPERTWSDVSNRSGPLVLRSQTLPDHAQNQSAATRSAPETPSGKRRGSLQLPSFKTLGISSIAAPTCTRPEVCHSSLWKRGHAQTQQSKNALSEKTSPASPLTGVSTPLTPPPEDAARPAPRTDTYRAQVDTDVYSNSSSDDTSRGSNQAQLLVFSQSQDIAPLQPPTLTESSSVPNPPWLSQAIQKIASMLRPWSLYEIQMVSQTLPSQAKDGRSRPTFEEVLQSLQTELNPSPYITITHAVPEARIMEEVPKTPPTTPGSRHEINDYFGSNQTIFTHAAVVPMYHSHIRPESSLGIEGRHTHHIAAPGSIKVSILERYIPPTMSSEIEDFFNVSPRSYLADRLSELSSDDGCLLLVHPTRNGGQAFSRKYISPVIDPFLRQFIMLNELTSHVASKMGHMIAVDNMITFEEMHDRLESLCHTLTARPRVRGQVSAYTITHSETANVVLDRTTWLDWYVEQEQSRLRQNLVEYHQAGGRMPQSEGNREVTVGMLTRDFVDGIKRSEEAAGEADIEMGVFVITRSRL